MCSNAADALAERSLNRPPVPNIEIEIKEIQIRPDHYSVIVEEGRVCCPCDLFVRLYLVNKADVPTTIKRHNALSTFPQNSGHYQYLAASTRREILYSFRILVQENKSSKRLVATAFPVRF